MLKITIIVLFALFGCSNTEIPNYIKVCKRNDPAISACIVKSIAKLRQKLIGGIAELGVPTLEPLRIDDMVLRNGMNLNLSDVIIHGAGSFVIKDFKSEIGKNRFAVLINVPEMDITGKHAIDMALLSIPLRGRGLFKAKFADVNIAGKMKGRLNGDYLKFDLFDIKISVSGIKQMSIEGLFKENPTLARASEMLIAENVDVFYEEMLPEVQKSLSSTLTRLANQITSHFTYDELFPL